MRKPLITLVFVLLIIAISYGVWRSTRQTLPSTGTVTSTPARTTNITYQNGAFTPTSVTIAAGDTVKFVNAHRAAILIAPNPHPIHSSFPKLYSDRIEPGDSFTFTFTEKAEVHFHNHYNPSVEGTIIVE